MTRTALITTAAVVAAFLSSVSTAAAQQTTAETPRGIIVSAPRIRRADVRGVGIQDYRVSVDALVTYSDLDLRTERGEEALGARIRQAAENLCAWLNELYPNTLSDGGRCASDAALAANREARQLVLAARR